MPLALRMRWSGACITPMEKEDSLPAGGFLLRRCDDGRRLERWSSLEALFPDTLISSWRVVPPRSSPSSAGRPVRSCRERRGFPMAGGRDA